MWVEPTIQVRFNDLRLNLAKYKKQQDDHVLYIFHYIDEAEGLRYEIDESSGLLAEETFVSGFIPRDQFTAACNLSVELKVINQALNAGSPIAGAQFSAPIFLRLGGRGGLSGVV